MEQEEASRYRNLLLITQYATDEGKRTQAGLAAVQIEDNHFCLEHIARNNTFPLVVREEAGKKSLESFAREGSYHHLKRMSTEEAIPETVRVFARENLSKAAEKAIENMGARQNPYYSRWDDLFFDDKLPEEVRRRLGEKVISCYANDRDHMQLRHLAENQKFPEDLREKAGRAFVELQVRSGEYTGLRETSKDRDLPKAVRMMAKERMEEAAVAAIEQKVQDGAYGSLSYIATDKTLPKEVREKAKEGMGIAAEKTMERYVRERDYHSLRSMTTPPIVPERIRQKAETAYKDALQTILDAEPPGSTYSLEQMAEDRYVPNDIRSKAKEKLRQYAQELADRLE